MPERLTNPIRPRGRGPRLDAAARHELEVIDRVLGGVRAETAADAELADLVLRLRGAGPTPSDAARERLDARFAERIAADRRVADGARAGRNGRIRGRLAGARSPRVALAGAGALATLLVTAVAAVSLLGGEDRRGLSLTGPATATKAPPVAPSPPPTEKLLDRAVTPPASTTTAPVTPPASTRAESGSTSALYVGAANGAGTGSSVGAVRRVERNATLTLAVAGGKIESTADRVIATTDRFGGYVRTSSVSGGDRGNASAEFELSLPADRFQQALAAYSGLAHVRERTQQTQDVTSPYRRATARVSAARVEISRLRALLAAAPADQAPALRLRLRAAERAATARQSALNGLRSRVSFVSLGVTIVADSSVVTSDRGVIGRAFDTAKHVLERIAAISIVMLAIICPLMLIAALAAFGFRRVRRARRDALLTTAAAPLTDSPPRD